MENIVMADIRNMIMENTFLDLMIKMFEKHQIIQHSAENVSVSFIIPDPQKTTDGINSVVIANHMLKSGYIFFNTL